MLPHLQASDAVSLTVDLNWQRWQRMVRPHAVDRIAKRWQQCAGILANGEPFSCKQRLGCRIQEDNHAVVVHADHGQRDVFQHFAQDIELGVSPHSLVLLLVKRPFQLQVGACKCLIQCFCLEVETLDFRLVFPVKFQIMALGAHQDQEPAGFGRKPEVGNSTRCQQQQLLADVQNPGDQSGRFQRVAQGAGFAQRKRPVVQGTGLYRKERKSFVERANLLNRPLRTRTVGGVGGDG